MLPGYIISGSIIILHGWPKRLRTTFSLLRYAESRIKVI